MLRTLLVKELREALASQKLQVAFLAACALGAVGSVLLVVDCQRALADHGERVQAHEQLLDELDEVTLTYGAVADLPLRPWQRLIRGASAGRDEPVFVGFLFAPYFVRHLAEVSANDVYPSVDLGFLLTVVLSLLAVLVGHDLVSREQERGTLRQVLANAVSRDAVLVAKWLGGFAVLAAALTALLAVTFALLLGLPRGFSLDGEGWRMAGVALVALLLAAAMLSLGLLVSCRCRQSSHALVILLFLWVVLAVVVPSLAPYAAAMARPVPGAAQELQKRLELTLEFEPAHGDGTIDTQTFQRRLSQLQEEHLQRLAQQMDLTRTLSYLSPVATAAHLAADLAGTGLEAQVRAGEAVRRFRERYVRFTEQLWAAKGEPQWRNARAAMEAQKPTRPVLELSPPSTAQTAVMLRPGLTVLVLYAVGLFLASHLAFLRKDLTA